LLAVEPGQEHLDRRLGQARTTNTHNTAATAAVASNSKCPPRAENLADVDEAAQAKRDRHDYLI
jgi:hypothetical protein